MVMVFEDHVALTPTGSSVAGLIPNAPVVVCVILVMAVKLHTVGVEEAAVTVLRGLTIISPVALTLPQPPVRGML